MAENGSVTDCKHGSHPSSALRKRAVANRVDAAVDGTEDTAFEPRLDRPAADLASQELTAGYDPVLPRRQRAEETVDRRARKAIPGLPKT